jgi:hypothetical protein
MSLKGVKTMNNRITGGCLCGLIAFEISGPYHQFYFCHCSRCQKSSGSAHATNIFGRMDSIKWLSGREHVKTFELPEAKYFNKAFCSHCGSPVPHKARSGDFLIIPAGSLNSDPEVRPHYNIFWDNRAVWYDQGCVAEKVSEYPKAF